MTGQNRSGCGRTFVVILLIGSCLGALGAIWALTSIPAQTLALFGPPAPTLGTVQRLTYGAQLLLYQDDLLTPRQADAGVQTFDIAPGETVNLITFRLQEDGLIRNADALRLYLIYAGLDTRIQAGRYQLSAAQSALEIAQQLREAVPNELIFGVLAGWRAEEIAASLPYSGLNITPEQFLLVVYQPGLSGLPEPWRSMVSLEGFLMPGQYPVERSISAEELILPMLMHFDQEVGDDLRQRYAAQGLDVREAVILASIVEREAVMQDEQAVIASVFLNRLQQGMRLESDPTVQYAVGYDAGRGGWWVNPLTAADLAIDSPYNTYRVYGLPPGPIANPGLQALQAVAYPAQTNYFYFRARCDGSGRHAFAVTYEEHLQNGCR
ncbi:MAG: endolytic transglycosylase MltG [Longilinea sp.]|nr:endolytic transglycosylase MltG [Longilinea sp.]MCA1954282.1 endolytic transglycosylase MltG [Anaerolinea sp.]